MKEKQGNFACLQKSGGFRKTGFSYDPFDGSVIHKYGHVAFAYTVTKILEPLWNWALPSRIAMPV